MEEMGPPAPEPRPRWWRRPLPIIAVAVLVAAGVTFALTRGGSSKLAIAGSITLTDSDGLNRSGGGTTCAGTGGYSDISDGAAVTVKNEKGAIIGTGTLNNSLALSSTMCDLFFQIRDVPKAKFYSVEVSHRGSITEPASRIDKKKHLLDFALTIGS